jgi:hypothetical protein
MNIATQLIVGGFSLAAVCALMVVVIIFLGERQQRKLHGHSTTTPHGQ